MYHSVQTQKSQEEYVILQLTLDCPLAVVSLRLICARVRHQGVQQQDRDYLIESFHLLHRWADERPGMDQVRRLQQTGYQHDSYLRKHVFNSQNRDS